MVSRRLFLHIGTEKTASTSIQKFVYLNRETLSEMGVTLCDSMGIPNNQKLVAFFQNHIDDYLMDLGVFDAQAKTEFFRGFLENLRDEIVAGTPEGGSVFITSELFHSRLRDQECIDSLREFLSSIFDEITVICYLREQASLATSFYTTRIKAGAFDTIDGFVNGITVDNHYFNYWIFLSKWSQAFGTSNIVVHIFEKEKLLNRNIFDDLLAIFDPDIDPRRFRGLQQRANKSLGPVGAAIGCKINTIYPRYHKDGTSNLIRWELMRWLSNSRLGVAGSIRNPRTQELYTMFLASNAEVAETYLKSDALLFAVPSETTFEKAVFASDSEMSDAMAEFFEYLFRNILQDRVLSREHGIVLRTAVDRLLQLPAALSAAEDILKIAQKINPEGTLIRDRLQTLAEIIAITERM